MRFESKARVFDNGHQQPAARDRLLAVTADVTGLLQAWSGGDAEALDQLAPLVQRELREMARRMLSSERQAVGWQPTDLVQESYVRLLDWHAVHWQNRAHFFATTARMMRRVLVDAARARQAAKRGHGVEGLSLEAEDVAAPAPGVDIVALNDALAELATLDPRPSQVVELRFFGGFSVEETAETLGVSVRTVINDWNTARAWLHHELASEADYEHRAMARPLGVAQRVAGRTHGTARRIASLLRHRAPGAAAGGRRARRLQWSGRRVSRNACPGPRRPGSGAGRAPLPEGTSVGPYRIVALLARGGMGDVYRATDPRLDRDVALKTLTSAERGDGHAVERFLQEARITASLDHPNIVKVFDVGMSNGRPFWSRNCSTARPCEPPIGEGRSLRPTHAASPPP